MNSGREELISALSADLRSIARPAGRGISVALWSSDRLVQRRLPAMGGAIPRWLCSAAHAHAAFPCSIRSGVWWQLLAWAPPDSDSPFPTWARCAGALDGRCWRSPRGWASWPMAYMTRASRCRWPANVRTACSNPRCSVGRRDGVCISRVAAGLCMAPAPACCWDWPRAPCLRCSCMWHACTVRHTSFSTTWRLDSRWVWRVRWRVPGCCAFAELPARRIPTVSRSIDSPPARVLVIAGVC